jgi:hypothetical protein
MKKRIIAVFACLLGAASVFAAEPRSSLTAGEALQKADRQFFIENKGQWHPDVLYLTRMGGLDVWITKYGVNYTFYKLDKKNNAKRADLLPGKFGHEMEGATLLGHRVLLKLQNYNTNPQREGKQKQEGHYNYLIGNDPGKHASNVGLYGEAVVRNVYSGIDLRYYFDKGYLRYDFVVQPGADPSQIKFELEGEFKEYMKNNTLCYTTRFGEVQMQDLYVYQQSDKKQVPAKFTQQNGVWTFQLSDYDKTQPLIIDPLVYSTYIGKSGFEYGNDIAIDNSGNAYIAGYTSSTDYDTTAGAFQTTHNGGFYDAFVTKLNSTGSGIIYSTFIGGTGVEFCNAIEIDGSGNAYITGYTNSNDYPTTSGAFQTTFGGLMDVFVTKLNSTGTGAIYSTYIGGSFDEYGYDIAIDGSGNAYIVGNTGSTDYDTTAGAFQTVFAGGGFDGFVTKLNGTGTGLIYSTYIGGTSTEFFRAIAIDGSGNAYITGRTPSTDYPITTGVYQNIMDGFSDVFVTKLNGTGSTLLYSTFIGGSADENAYSIALDGTGNAYITGVTSSTDYDVTAGAFQTTLDGGVYDAFVTKLNSSGTALLYSTYIGGSDFEESRSIAVDASGNAYVTGYTFSTNYDVTPGAVQTVYDNTAEVFVTKLNSTGNSLMYSTYLGGDGYEEAYAIAIDGTGVAYITGNTSSSDFDVTPGAFHAVDPDSMSGEVFVTKICLSTIPLQPGAISGNTTVCQGSSQTYSIAAVPGATSYTWTLPGGWTGTSTTSSITATVGANGGNITVSANNLCAGSAPQTLAINVIPLDLSVTNNANTLTANQAGATYQWIDCNNNNAPISGATSQSFSPTSSGSYAVIVSTPSCSDTSACQTVAFAGIDAQDLSKQVFSIYPNPNHGNFTIQSTEAGVFELMDVAGRVLKTYTITNTQQTVNENLPAGMYFVREKASGRVQNLIIE